MKWLSKLKEKELKQNKCLTVVQEGNKQNNDGREKGNPETLKRTQAEMKTVKAEITKEIKSSLEINENETQQSKHSGKLPFKCLH